MHLFIFVHVDTTERTADGASDGRTSSRFATMKKLAKEEYDMEQTRCRQYGLAPVEWRRVADATRHDASVVKQFWVISGRSTQSSVSWSNPGVPVLAAYVCFDVAPMSPRTWKFLFQSNSDQQRERRG